MERFLRYSLSHQRTIRGVLLLGSAMAQKTFTVLALEQGEVTLRLGGQKGKILVLPIGDILSCDYARGDHGDA